MIVGWLKKLVEENSVKNEMKRGKILNFSRGCKRYGFQLYSRWPILSFDGLDLSHSHEIFFFFDFVRFCFSLILERSRASWRVERLTKREVWTDQVLGL